MANTTAGNGWTARIAELLVTYRERLRASLWFVPGLIVVVASALAVGLIQIDGRIDRDVLDRWPALFGAGAGGARDMLLAIAGSMITVAGVVFSITLVVMSLASTQYSPRVLRSFMSDHTNQSVLGVFVGIFAYALIVLRSIRGPEEGAFVPSVAVFGAVVLAFVGIGYLIYFIHHVGESVQASSILERITEETSEALERAWHKGDGAWRTQRPDPTDLHGLERVRTPLRASCTGYLVHVEALHIVRCASQCDACVEMDVALGGFVMRDQAFAHVLSEKTLRKSALEKLGNGFEVDRQRSADLDPAFGIRQLADIAQKALASGVSDATTAGMVIDYTTSILVRIAQDGPRPRYVYDGSDATAPLRLVLAFPTFADLMEHSYAEVRHVAKGNVTVLMSLARALSVLEQHAHIRDHRNALAGQALALRQTVELENWTESDREPVLQELEDLERRLRGARERTGLPRART